VSLLERCGLFPSYYIDLDDEGIKDFLRTIRTLIHHWTINPLQVILLINTYGPNFLSQNNNFFIELADYISTTKNSYLDKGIEVSIIIARDMNAHLTELDTQLPSEKQFEGFQYLIKTLELQDTFRCLHPDRKKFTTELSTKHKKLELTLFWPLAMLLY